MKISVITVSYNSASTIADAIRSVQTQDYQDIEHIIVDGKSSDETMSIVTSMAKPSTRYVSEKDSGIYDAMNKGILMATGDIVGFINSDDLYASPSVFRSVAQVLSDPHVDACYSDLCYVRQDNPNVVVRYWKSSEVPENAFVNSWVPPHPTFFVKRKIYEKNGGFCLDYKLAADFDLMLRFLVVCGIRAKYVPQVWVKMRLGGATSKSLKNVLRQNKEIVHSLKRRKQSFSVVKFVVSKVCIRMQQYFWGAISRLTSVFE